MNKKNTADPITWSAVFFSYSAIFSFVITISSILFGMLIFFMHNQFLNFSSLEQYNPGKPSIVLDDKGNEWARFKIDRRERISYESLPENIIQAFIAAEDHDFFNHHGISWKCMIRSFLMNMYYGKFVQGASTITQQLVKLLFFDSRKTLGRKLKEQFFALLIEHHFTKQQIMETYLNNVCFGCGIYGIEAASQRFWNKHATDLELHEAALLAAIVKAPAHYYPLLYPLSAQRRRNIVLHSMMQLDFISEQTYQEARKKTLDFVEQQDDSYALYAREAVRQMLEEIVGKDALYRGGLTIQTTINQTIQRYAQEEFAKQFMVLKNKMTSSVDGALLCLEVQTGEIKALIGGVDFKQSQFNRALQAKRQLGSLFKPLIYAVAVEQGMNFAQTEIDEPIEFEQAHGIWAPRNSSLKYHGVMTLAKALSHSNNIISIKTLLQVGYDPVIALAQKCGIQCDIPRYPSLALGCIDVSLKEAIGMFNVFANHGVYVEPHLLKWIKDEWGTKQWKYKLIQRRCMSADVSGQVAKVLSLSIERAKKRFPHYWIDSESIGKTGTTNDCRTCWFAGSTPSFTTGIYIGCDDNRSLGQNIFPSTTVFPIWLALNRYLQHNKKTFAYDSNLKEIVIDGKNGQLTGSKNSNALTILVKREHQ